MTAINRLLVVIQKAASMLWNFAVILFLGIVAIFLLAIPWLLRIAAMLIWLIGGYFAVTTIQCAYSAFSSSGEVILLQLAAIVLLVAIAMLLIIESREKLWGGLALGGTLFSFASLGIQSLASTTAGTLILQVLPPTLLTVSMFVMSIRLRAMRRSGQAKFSAPLFVWLSKLKKGDDSEQ